MAYFYVIGVTVTLRAEEVGLKCKRQQAGGSVKISRRTQEMTQLRLN